MFEGKALVPACRTWARTTPIFTVKTHLSYQLKPGDYAFGYDLYSINSNNDKLEKYGQGHKLPDAVLVRKSYKKIAGKQQEERERVGVDIDEIAMGIGCIDLNPSDEKELDELIEDLTI